MTAGEAWAGWMAMSWGERAAFMRTCVEHGVLTAPEANALMGRAQVVAGKGVH